MWHVQFVPTLFLVMVSGYNLTHTPFDWLTAKSIHYPSLEVKPPFHAWEPEEGPPYQFGPQDILLKTLFHVAMIPML